MICKKCGAKNRNNAKKCNNCGKELKKEEAKIIKSEKVDKRSLYNEDELVQRVSRNELLARRDKYLTIAAIFFVIVCIASSVALVYYTRQNLNKINNELKSNVPDGEEKILTKIDALVGENNYEVIESYESSTGKYVAKIVLNEYKEAYEKYNNKAKNKYLIMFTLNDTGELDSFYETFMFGMQYENKIKEELSNNINNEYKYIVSNNPLLETSYNYYNNAENLEQALDYMKQKKTLLGTFNLTIFVKSDATEESIKEMINNNSEYFKNNNIDEVTVCVIKEDKLLNELDFDNGSIDKKDNNVDKYFMFTIE